MLDIISIYWTGLKLVISGGQIGVDLGALISAKKHNIKTGGTAPKDYRTARGNNPDLNFIYGLSQNFSKNYQSRTKRNVIDSDGTLIIASNVGSSGTALTIRYCVELNKPVHIVRLPCDIDLWKPEDNAAAIVEWLNKNAIEVLNVAGNHAMPELHESATIRLLGLVFKQLEKEGKLVHIPL